MRSSTRLTQKLQTLPAVIRGREASSLVLDAYRRRRVFFSCYYEKQ